MDDLDELFTDVDLVSDDPFGDASAGAWGGTIISSAPAPASTHA